MKQLGSFALLAFVLLTVAAGSAGQRSVAPAQLPLEPCQIQGVEDSAQCGRLDVFENRPTRQGRKIAIKVVVLPATGKDRAPDPIFILAGGPGQAASSSGLPPSRPISCGRRSRGSSAWSWAR